MNKTTVNKTTIHPIQAALIRLKFAMGLDAIKESTEGKGYPMLATSYDCGQGRPDYFAITQYNYHGIYE